MSNYLGDYDTSSTVSFLFTTVDSTGAPTTPTSTSCGAYFNTSTTEVNGGITWTTAYDGRAGLNLISVTTASDGTTYAVNREIHLICTAGSCGTINLAGYALGHFSIRNRTGLYPTTAGRTLDVSAGGGAGVDWANVKSPTTSLALTGTTIATTQQVDVNTIKTNPVVNAGTITFPTTATLASTTNITAATGIDITKILGTAISTPATAGILDINLKNIANAAVSTSTAQLGVNAINWAGSAIPSPTVPGVPNVNTKTWNDLTTVALPLISTTAGRTLNVSTTGGAGIDWANVQAPTTTLNLSGTTISSAQQVDVNTIKTNPVVNGGTITFPTTATLASTTNIASGTITTVSGNVNGSVGSVTGAVGSVTGNVGGNVVGSVGSVTGSVGSVTGLTASDVGAIKTKTDFLPSAAAGAAGGLFISGTNSGLTITAALNLKGGLTITQSTTDGNGVTITGNANGAGVNINSGTLGKGVDIEGVDTALYARASGAGSYGGAIIGAVGAGLLLSGNGDGNAGLVSSAGSGNSAGATFLSTGNKGAVVIQATGNGPGISIIGGGSGGDGIDITTTSGHGIDIVVAGTSKHGIFVTGGDAGTSDGINAVAGSGGVDIRGNITGAISTISVDNRTEPGQGAPSVSTSMAAKVDYLYKAWRNKITQSTTQYMLFADNTTTVDQKTTVSDDGTTFTKGEIATGP